MFRVSIAVALLAVSASGQADAQCFNRNTCDPSSLEIHSQLSVAIPVTESTDTAQALQTMEDARRQLSTLSDREFEAIKAMFGPDSKLKSVSTNSNLQDSGFRGKVANVSASYTYEVKKPVK